jgi:PEP-CTERM motif
MQMKSLLVGAAIVVGFGNATAASAAVALVKNGDFEATSNGANKFLHLTDVIDWTSGNSVDAVYAAGAADTVGADQGDPNRFIYLWGPGDGTANGLTTASPAGGNFIAMDSDPAFQVPLSQEINGLTPGAVYTLRFYYAAAQYNDRQGSWNGETFSGYDVTFGNDSFSAPAFTIPSHGFSGWSLVTTSFTAQSATQTLSFLAQGGPGGLPPVALLDGVSLTANVPEAATWVMLIAGFGLVGAAARRRRTVAA